MVAEMENLQVGAILNLVLLGPYEIDDILQNKVKKNPTRPIL